MHSETGWSNTRRLMPQLTSRVDTLSSSPTWTTLETGMPRVPPPFVSLSSFIHKHFSLNALLSQPLIHNTLVGLTHLADLSNAEYQKIYLGTHFDGTQRLKEAVEFVPTEPLADTVNWNTKGAVTGMSPFISFNKHTFVSIINVLLSSQNVNLLQKPSRTKANAEAAGLSPPLEVLRVLTSCPLETSSPSLSRTWWIAPSPKETMDAMVVWWMMPSLTSSRTPVLTLRPHTPTRDQQPSSVPTLQPTREPPSLVPITFFILPSFC